LTEGKHAAPSGSSNSLELHAAEPTEGEQRLKQLKELEAALRTVKDSMQSLATLAETQTKAVETQWARVCGLRDIQEAACNREAYLQAYGRMWT